MADPLTNVILNNILSKAGKVNNDKKYLGSFSSQNISDDEEILLKKIIKKDITGSKESLNQMSNQNNKQYSFNKVSLNEFTETREKVEKRDIKRNITILTLEDLAGRCQNKKTP